MHGRVKVRTTEEERERKKKEQALKVRAYRAAMARIQKKRSAGELDDEMLTLSMQILIRNPDVTTLWNIRRECVLVRVHALQKLLEQSPIEQQTIASDEDVAAAIATTTDYESSANAESNADKMQAVYARELQLTEQCLMVNPKSYNAWHHRCWTLEQNPLADWQREVQLCNKYLKYDERNFHTWDYRRYVTAKAKVPEQQELDFCTEKIKVNFSNYSSWHHRSLLLPVLYPYEGAARPKRPMSESKLKEELEMVLTAAFTDPNDSSAWFYQRWLLGNAAQKEPATIAAFRCSGQRAIISFNKSNTNFAQAKVQLITPDQTHELQPWTPENSNNTIWQCNAAIDLASSTAEHSYALQVADLKLPLSVLPGKGLYYFQPPHATESYTEEVVNELRAQLQSCLDLLEYEPDSKWTLLTSALLMRAIDTEQYHAQSLSHLCKLQRVDALRAGYYKDLAVRWSLELALVKWPHTKQFPLKFEFSTEATTLNTMPYSQYLITADEVDLSGELQDHT